MADDVAAVEDGDQSGVIHAAVELGHELAGLADQVGFDFDAERQIAAVASFGDLPELVGGLRATYSRGIGTLGVVEREAADQLGFKGVGQLAGVLDVALEILIERDEAVLGAVLFVAELYLADRRADRRDVHAEFVFEVAKLDDVGLSEVHHVLDAGADINEAQAVVLQAEGGERGELRDGGAVAGRFVGKAGEDNLGVIRHKYLPMLSIDSCRYIAATYSEATVSVIPPRALKEATIFIQRGCTTAERSSRMVLVTCS